MLKCILTLNNDLSLFEARINWLLTTCKTDCFFVMLENEKLIRLSKDAAQ
jgi:hypothetical protein